MHPHLFTSSLSWSPGGIVITVLAVVGTGFLLFTHPPSLLLVDCCIVISPWRSVFAHPSMTQSPTQVTQTKLLLDDNRRHCFNWPQRLNVLVVASRCLCCYCCYRCHHSGQRHGKVCDGLLSSNSIVIAIDRPLWTVEKDVLPRQ